MQKKTLLACSLLFAISVVPSASAECDPPTVEVFGVGYQECHSSGNNWDGSSYDFEAWETHERVVYWGSGDLVAYGEYQYQCNNAGGGRSCTDGDKWTDAHVRVIGSEASVSNGQMDGRPGWHVCYSLDDSIVVGISGSSDCPILLNP